MEILIIGVIIVALMVYASTRIKKTAAAAFAQERIETDNFSLVKPEGFLNPLNDESEFAFYAYSKEFGKDDAEEFRQAEIFVRSFSDKSLNKVRNEIKSGAENIISEEVSDNKNICHIETEKMIEETAFYEFYRIMKSGATKNVYELKMSVLKDFEDVYQERLTETIESFRVK